MKNLKQIRETYDNITEKSVRDQRNLDAMVEAGLFEEKKLPVLKKILENSADKMSGSEKRFVTNLLESLITQFAHEQLDEAKKTNNYLSKYDPRGPKNWPSDSDLPPVLILKRKAIRVYPDNTKVALYYAQAIDRYVSVPYGGGNIMAVNEAVTPRRPPDIGKKKNITDSDLPEIRKHLINKTLTSKSPLADAIINLGIYSGIKSRLRKAAKAKANQPAAPTTQAPAAPAAPATAPRGQPGWRPRIVKESFKNHLEILREQAATATMPAPGAGIDIENVKRLAKKYGPKALKLAKQGLPVLAGNLPKIGVGTLARANPWIAAAQMALSPTAANAPEVEWLKTKEKKKETAQDRVKADAAAAASVKAANQKTFDALKDATKKQGADATWSDTYSQTKTAKETQQKLARAKAETSSRAITYPNITGMGDIVGKRTKAERSAAATSWPGAGTIGMGDITKVKAPPRNVDVAGAGEAEKAAKAKGGAPAIRIPSGVGGDVTGKIETGRSAAAPDVPAISAQERQLAKQAAERKATRQVQSQAQAQAGDIAAAQAGDKTRVKDKAEEKADAKAQSQAISRSAAETLSRATSRTRVRLNKNKRFRLPDISLPSSQPGPKEPGPNYAFGLKPSVSTPTPVTNRAAVDKWMDIINRKANQAMLRENTPRSEDDEEVGTAASTQDTSGNIKPVYNFRKRPRVSVNKATSTDAAVQRWMERIGRQANQSMLRQQDQQESVYHAIQNMVENNISESTITIGQQPITINNTVARKIVSLHEAMNKKNKKKMEEMLNEGAASFNKVLTFAVRH